MAEERRLDRKASLELLRNQHTFPGGYVFRVVARPGDSARIVSAIAVAVGGVGSFQSIEEKKSRAGTYVSLRIHTEMNGPEAVLEVYDVIGRLEGVIMTM